MTNSIGFPINNQIAANSDMGKKAKACLEKVRQYEDDFVKSNQTSVDLDPDPNKVRLDSYSDRHISNGRATIGEYGAFKDKVQEMTGSSSVKNEPKGEIYPIVNTYYEKKTTSDGTEFFKVNTDILKPECTQRVQEFIRYTSDGYVLYENKDELTEHFGY